MASGYLVRGVEFVSVDAGAVPVGYSERFVCALGASFPCQPVEFLDFWSVNAFSTSQDAGS